MSIRILSVVASDSLKSSLGTSLRQVLGDAQLHWARDLTSAADTVDKETNFKFIFIQSGWTSAELLPLINLIRTYDKESRSTLILVVNSESSDEENLSAHLSLGFSAMLVEPFSFGSIKEALQLSESLSRAGSVARLTVAAGLQIKAHLVGEKKMKPGGDILSSIKTACQIFETENPGKSVLSVAEDLSLMPTEERIKMNISSIYQGVSERVRKLVAKKHDSESDQN